MSTRYSKIIAVVVLVLVTFCLYFNSLHGDFLIDDQSSILGNDRIHNLTVYWNKYFSFSPGCLQEFLHALAWQMGGGNPYYFHLLAVLAHIGCVVLLFSLCQYLFHVTALSFLSALIFAAHPIHTEAVSWISADSYVFSSFFFLLSFILYVRSRRSLVYLVLAVVSSGLCLAVGNTVVSLPFLLLCFELISRVERDKNRSLRIFILLLLAVIAILFAGIFFFMRNAFTRLIFLHRGPQYLVVVTKAFVYYLKILNV